MMLTVREGESAAYSVNLTAPPTAEAGNEPWWVFVHVDGQRRADGRYKSIHWVPSIGREFYMLLTIEVATLEDETEEPEEGFTVELSDPAGATLEDDTGAGTIRDIAGLGDSLPALSITDAAPAAEGGTAKFLVTLSAATEHVVTASYATADGTARAGADYTPATGTLRFEPGDTTRTIRVPVLDDETLEETEGLHGGVEPRGRGDAGGRNRQGNHHRRRRGQAARALHRRCRAGGRGNDGAVSGQVERGDGPDGDRGVRHGGRDGSCGLGLCRGRGYPDFSARGRRARRSRSRRTRRKSWNRRKGSQ